MISEKKINFNENMCLFRTKGLKLENKLLSLADPRGVLVAHSPSPTESSSFVFAHVFAEKRPCRRLATPQMARHPPMGNPGSAAVYYDKKIINGCTCFDGLSIIRS